MLINKVSDDACYWNGHDVVIAIGGIFFIERFYVAWRRKLKLSIQWPCSLTTEGVSAVLLSFLCLWNVPGVGAFDHLNGPQCGAFERHFGPGRGEFERQFSKKSNARGVSRGGHVEASIWLIHYDHVKTAFRFLLRLRRVRFAYDLVKTRFSESEAEAEELNKPQRVGTCIVVGLSFFFCFRLRKPSFH